MNYEQAVAHMAASVGWILVSDKTFNTPIIAIHCSKP